MHARRPNPSRRGNTIVLVAGVLALLVIVATAYVTRTQGGRRTSVAVKNTELRHAKDRQISEAVAGIVSGALFPRPVDFTHPDFNATFVADSNIPRLSPLRNPVPFGVDQDNDGPDGIPGSLDDDGRPDAPYNFAPYWVTPYTNWPDSVSYPSTLPNDVFGPNDVPYGPGNPFPTLPAFQLLEFNPIGNPGFGDCRWLADTEPIRWDTGLEWSTMGIGIDRDAFSPQEDAFFMWRHMTNIASADNGWRICTDISDVFDLSGDAGRLGELVMDMNLPVEQFLLIGPTLAGAPAPLHSTVTGDVSVSRLLNEEGPGALGDRFANWFFDYPDTYRDSDLLPPNFVKLSDLNANGISDFLPGDTETPPNNVEAFLGPPDEFDPTTHRYQVSRFLADADGDGFTDSFWHLAPTPVEKGIRQLVALRIVDNSSMLNLSAASRFVYSDLDTRFVAGSKTLGATPADLALVSDMNPFTDNTSAAADFTWNVGYFDMAHHQEGYTPFSFTAPLYGVGIEQSWYPGSEGGYPGDQGRWTEFRDAIGISNNNNFFQFETQAERLLYWQLGGRRPLAALGGLTPFGMADEMELRLYAGQNYPYVVSRLELAINAAGSTANAFLRTNANRQEASEYFNQLNNRELRYDHRHRLTVYNGSRNDRRPPWIWPDGDGDGFPDFYARDYDFDGDITDIDLREFEALRRKYDLRTPFTEFGGRALVLDVDNDGLIENPEAGPTNPRIDDDFNNDGIITARDHLFRLRNTFEQSMIYEDTRSATIIRQAYFGTGTTAVDATRRMAASLAANVKAFVDEDIDAPLVDAVPVASTGGLGAKTSSGFLGLEPQPFLVEAFFGRMYKGFTVPDVPPNTPMLQWTNRGSRVIFDIDPTLAVGDPSCEADKNYSEVMAVQVANPFNEPIPLAGYEIELFGQRVSLLTALNGAMMAAPPSVTLSDPMGRPITTEMSDALNAGFLPPANEKLIDLDANNIPDGRQVPTLILWAVKDNLDGDLVDAKWLDFLDLDPGDLPLGTAVYRVPSATWRTGCRGFYDQDGGSNVDCNCNGVLDSDDVDPGDPDGDGNVFDDTDGNGVPDECEAEDAILLYRDNVVIDRMDSPTDRELHEAISDDLIKPPPLISPLDDSPVCNTGDVLADPADPLPVFPGLTIAAPGDPIDYWIEWTRTTRAWGVDLDGDKVYEDRERNPRFVFADKAIVTEADTYEFAASPDSAAGDGSSDWFTQSYKTMTGDTQSVKPTFFDLRGFIEAPGDEDYDLDPASGVQPIYNSYPDKGWYGQGDEPSDPIKGSSGELLIDHPFPMQMMIKQRDFDQVGELLNVFIFAHELTINNATGAVVDTARTFSEFMALAPENLRAGRLEPQSGLIGQFTKSELDLVSTAGSPPPDFLYNPRHALPALPAAVRMLDAFVCDGPGQVRDYNDDGFIDLGDERLWNAKRYLNANGFSGRITPGLINLNTATPEVMRTLPHFYRKVHRDPSATRRLNSYVRVPDAIVRYRERTGNPLVAGNPVYGPVNIRPISDSFNIGPGYQDRGAFDNGVGNPGYLAGMRADRGMASPNELLLVRRPGKGMDQAGNPIKQFDGTELRYDLGSLDINCLPVQFGDSCTPNFVLKNSSWQIDFGALREEDRILEEFRDQFGPLETPFIEQVRRQIENETIHKLRHPVSTAEPRMFSWDTAISTDVNGERFVTPNVTDFATGLNTFAETVLPDATAADAEEANLLFAGASNLISSRSDVFTVYFKVRSFRQNPTTGVWNALDPESIVDDTRYVMMVDRSEVNLPTDKPKILYFERLPN